MKPIAFIDIRTTGPDPEQDDIVELAALRVHPQSLEIEDSIALVVLPDVVGRAVDAPSEAFLGEALERLEPVLRGAVLAGHEVESSLAFLSRAWREHGYEPDGLADERLDVAPLLWAMLDLDTDELSLDVAARRLGLREADAESAVGRARLALQVVRRAVAHRDGCVDVSGLGRGGREVVATLLARLRASTPSRRSNADMLRSVVDALASCAAELVRLERAQRPGGVRTRRVYVCHPFRDDPVRNAERVRDICRELVAEGRLPVAPHLFLPQFIDEQVYRDVALRLCLELLDDCDEVRVYGSDISEGMALEIDRAEARGIEVKFLYPLGAVPEPRELPSWS